MTARTQERLTLAALLLVGALVFGIGITWGLPSRTIDPFLFGEREPWSGQTIRRLAGGRPESTTRGADVDATPMLRESRSAVVNATDEQRAQILLRYRLYTCQPDEMITLMSLSEMRPGQGQLDPKLYQYGGFWIYSVGALLLAASRLHLVNLKQDLTYYLDFPEQFGRFYVVARAYSAAWGLLGAWAVFWITRRLTALPGGAGASGPKQTDEGNAHALPAFAAVASYLALPVVLNMAHEAKPHLPAAALMLWAVLAAGRYVETGTARWWVAAGLICGLAFGTVLSALPVFILLPLMVILRRAPWGYRVAVLAGSGLLGALVYLITNPYVLINWFTNRAVLESNLKNSLAMYGVGGWGEGLHKTVYLLGEAATPVIALLGLLVPLILLALRWDELRSGLTPASRRLTPPADGQDKGGGASTEGAAPSDPRITTALLLAAPALLVLIQFCSLAAGKPSEYGRFLAFPAAALAISAVASVQAIRPATARRWQVIIVLAALIFGSRYVYAFYRDTAPDNSRRTAAAFIRDRTETTLLAPAEPAPYNMPPVDLFSRTLVVEPIITAPAPGQLLVFPTDHPAQVNLPSGSERLWPTDRSRPLGEAEISWADKTILIVAPNPAMYHPRESAKP